jgi:ribosomal protein S20
MQKNTKLAAAGLTVGLLGGGAIAVVAGLPSLAGASSSPTWVQATDDTTVESDDTSGDHTTHLQDALQPLIDDGTITQAQADAVIAALEAARPEGGMGRHGGFGHGGAGLTAAATALGVTEDELRTELRSGSSLADVAAAKGVDVQAVIDAIVAEATAAIDQAVTDGRLTADEAAEKKAELSERVTAMVNGEMPVGGPMGRGGHHHHGDGTIDDATS